MFRWLKGLVLFSPQDAPAVHHQALPERDGIADGMTAWGESLRERPPVESTIGTAYGYRLSSLYFGEIESERVRQLLNWGRQNDLTDAQYLCILSEQVGSVARAIVQTGDVETERRELVDVAAVAIAMIERIDGRG